MTDTPTDRESMDPELIADSFNPARGCYMVTFNRYAALLAAKEAAEADLNGLRDAYTGAMEDKRMWKRRALATEAERDALREAANQSRLAFAGDVSAQSAIDLLDKTLATLDQPKEGKDDEQ